MIPLAAIVFSLLAGATLPPLCHVRGLLPDPACTPGAVSTHSLAIVCGEGTRTRRHVSAATRRAVLRAYGIEHREAHRYELDHLIPLELGGSNAIANLWPEPGPDFHRKDRVENELHLTVCAGRMPLVDAQNRIARDWTDAQSAVAP